MPLHFRQSLLRHLNLLLALALLAAGTAGCRGSTPAQSTVEAPETPLFPSATPSPDVSRPAPTATPSPTPEGPITLRIWVPPQFDPQADTSAGEVFRERLNEFSSRRPGVRVEVRVKAEDGPGGLLDMLTTASAAAPQALPDLVALPRDLLETAALKGLLHPYSNQTSVMEDSNWYSYARQLAHLQEGLYGLPFAGDALVMAYHLDKTTEPLPIDWAGTIEAGKILIFPAADPQALFTLLSYQSNDGQVRNDQGHPYLDARALSDVLTFYSQAEEGGVMPDWMVQYQTDDPVWESFQGNRADHAAVWASFYLAKIAEDETVATRVGIAPLPTADGIPFTLASGWVWALASQFPERQALTVELAEFLVDNAFLGQWNRASGYLPPRPGALKINPEDPLQQVANQISLSARLLPGTDVINSLSGPLQQAVTQILKKQIDPLTAAQDVALRVSGP